MASSYEKKKFFGVSETYINDTCNIFSLFILEGKFNSLEVVNKLKKNIFMHKFYNKLKMVILKIHFI